MQTLHIELKSKGDAVVEFRYYWENPNDFQKRTLKLSEITDLLKAAELDYYTPLPEDFAKTGRKLFNWLDGSDRHLTEKLKPFQRNQGLIIAIDTAEKLAHFPWELLHDGSRFLVERSIIPVRWFRESFQEKASGEPANRPLRVLFMATSPLDVEPVLDFETEEAMILEATERQPLQLEVEESGCLTELSNTVTSYTSDESDYFDVLHLTGHAAILNGQPRFLTETETGERYDASAEDIAQALPFSIPRLVFLSGCRTGQAAKAGDVPSMAEALLQEGATAVLGWGRPVLDTNATQAAVALYSSLAAGKSVSQAVALTYKVLIKQNARDWHLLRLYVVGELPKALVTPLNTPERKLLSKREAAKEFLDSTRLVKVTDRQGFVGRRRQLQNCLQALRIVPDDKVGVLIYGMGGLGKSALAARICDRLSSRFERLVWVGKIDEPEVVNRLAEKLEDQVLREQLLNSAEKLQLRVCRALNYLAEEKAKQILLVLDDFEQNLEQREQGFVLSSDAAKVLTALVWALQKSGLVHRLIITCRYNFDFSELQYFYKQPLTALSPADIQKKCRRLESFQTNSKITLELQKQALKIADGNPRLLEWLNKTLQDNAINHAEILASLAKNPTELREQVLAQELLNCIDEPMQQMLQLGRVFKIPVPQAAFLEICGDIPDLSTYIKRAIDLGLLESSTDETLKIETLKVPRILPLNLEHSEDVYRQAEQCLYRLWWQQPQPRTEQECLEVHRLALLGKDENISFKFCVDLSYLRNITSRFYEVISLCDSTLETITNQQYRAWILIDKANAYNNLGKYQEAINFYEESKNIAELLQNRDIFGAVTVNLGNCYHDIGQISQAIKSYEQALEIANELENKYSQCISHHNLAGCYVNLGRMDEAESSYQKALEIAKENQYKQSEANIYGDLCDLYGLKGDAELAINNARKALNILEEIPDFKLKGTVLQDVVKVLIDEERYEEAILYINQGIKIATSIDSAKLCSENYSLLACAYLYSSDDKIKDAWLAAKEAIKKDVPQNNHYVLLLLGLIALKQGNLEVAHKKFTAALVSAEQFISENQSAYRAWDTKWLALSGLTLSIDDENQNYTSAAEDAYQTARSINSCNGVLRRVRRLFKKIRSVDAKQSLEDLQSVVMQEWN